MKEKEVIAYAYFSDLGTNTRENAIQCFKDYIENKNWHLKEIFLHTGPKMRNNKMIKQIEDIIENKKVDIIILLRLKHLGKEKDFYNFIDKALAHHVNVISIKDNFNTLDNNCKFQHQVISSMFMKKGNKKIIDR